MKGKVYWAMGADGEEEEEEEYFSVPSSPRDAQRPCCAAEGGSCLVSWHERAGRGSEGGELCKGEISGTEAQFAGRHEREAGGEDGKGGGRERQGGRHSSGS